MVSNWLLHVIARPNESEESGKIFRNPYSYPYSSASLWTPRRDNAPSRQGRAQVRALLQQPILARQIAQRTLRARAQMLNHLGGRERAEPSASAVVGAARETGQEAGGEQIARPGRIHHPLDRKGRYR